MTETEALRQAVGALADLIQSATFTREHDVAGDDDDRRRQLAIRALAPLCEDASCLIPIVLELMDDDAGPSTVRSRFHRRSGIDPDSLD